MQDYLVNSVSNITDDILAILLNRALEKKLVASSVIADASSFINCIWSLYLEVLGRGCFWR